MDKEVEKHLNVQYGKFVPHPSVNGYVTDKELFEWALDAVERRVVELEEEWADYVKSKTAHQGYTYEMLRISKALETVKAKRVYLKEVLDCLG